MCYASRGLNTRFISLICSLPYIYTLSEKCTQSPHIFLTDTPLKRASHLAPSAENEAFIVNELSLNCFQLNCKKEKIPHENLSQKPSISTAVLMGL